MSMLHRFQFQYGTIKTYDHFRDKGGKVFQFQYGTIKTLALTLYTMMRNYFNSNMVQLKQKAKMVLSMLLYTFQFHDGTIKTLIYKCCKVCNCAISIP